VTPLLGIDLGSKRIGVALSDPTGTLASPVATVLHRSGRVDVTRVAALCTEHHVSAVVVGWPRNMDGTSGAAARQAEQFAERLRALTGLPVHLWDERLSTVAAERTLVELGARRRRRREVRDRVAAAVLLQAYLDARARAPRDRRVQADEVE